jgi:SAM-dependent methyltransferase
MALAGQVDPGWVAHVLIRERSVARSVVGGDDALISTLAGLGLVAVGEASVTPLARLDAIADFLVASDLRRRCRLADFVVGPGPASFTLARAVRPPAGGRVLDLGCGSGIQGLLLGRRVDVLGLDLNPRAVSFTRFNAALNGHRRLRVEVGDFLGDEPDRALDRRFETVIANPPFVLTPSTELLYRDRPLAGDEVMARTIERVARALAPGGRGYVLGNWIDRGGSWADPVRSWLASSGATGAAVPLASLDAAAYARAWSHDLPAADRGTAAAAWAASLRREGIERIHVGLVAIAGAHRSTTTPRFTASERRPDVPTWRVLEAGLAG